MNNLVEGAINSPTDPKFPSACNWMQGASFYGWPYSYRWSLGVRTVTPGQPARAAIGNRDSGKPFIPARDAVEEIAIYTELAAGNQSMTQAQWDQWTTQPTDQYVLQCVADNLGVTLIPAESAKPATAKKTTRTAPAAKRASKKKARK